MCVLSCCLCDISRCKFDSRFALMLFEEFYFKEEILLQSCRQSSCEWSLAQNWKESSGFVVEGWWENLCLHARQIVRWSCVGYFFLFLLFRLFARALSFFFLQVEVPSGGFFKLLLPVAFSMRTERSAVFKRRRHEVQTASPLLLKSKEWIFQTIYAL